MATVLPIALTCLLFTSMTASFPYVVHARELSVPVPVPPSELRTGVPYYMVPENLGLCGLAPRINLKCPHAIGEANFDMVPVTFSLPGGHDEIVPLDSDVRISFNVTLPDNVSSTWGYSVPAIPLPSVEPICLGCSSNGFVPGDFRIQDDGVVYNFRVVDGSIHVMELMNIVSVFDPWARGVRLALSNEGNPGRFSFYEAEGYYHQGIKSVA